MKKLIIFVLLTSTLQGFSQDEEGNGEKKGFKKENLFTGGSVTLSFGNQITVLGVSPHIGYSLTKWADVGIAFNYNYISQRDYYEYGDKARQTVYGPGAFARIFPFRFLFAQAQYEYNFVHFRYIPASNGTYQAFNQTRNVSSMLIGVGYAGGREPGYNSFYYFSVLWDVAGNANSPYVDGLGRALPIIRAGYNIALFQGKRRR